jgi:hypothetical protein
VSALTAIVLLVVAACLWIARLVVTQVLTREFDWWAPRLANRIARVAARAAPGKHRTVLRGTWLAELEAEQVSGKTRVLLATGFVRAAARMRWARRPRLSTFISLVAEMCGWLHQPRTQTVLPTERQHVVWGPGGVLTVRQGAAARLAALGGANASLAIAKDLGAKVAAIGAANASLAIAKDLGAKVAAIGAANASLVMTQDLAAKVAAIGGANASLAITQDLALKAAALGGANGYFRIAQHLAARVAAMGGANALLRVAGTA